jgi:hypothetical protein
MAPKRVHNLVGKRLGKLTVVGEEYPPEDDIRWFKYAGKWYRVICECGTDKLLPKTALQGIVLVAALSTSG